MKIRSKLLLASTGSMPCAISCIDKDLDKGNNATNFKAIET